VKLYQRFFVLLPVILLSLCTLSYPEERNPIEQWQAYETAVRDGRLPREEAIRLLPVLVNDLSTYCTAHYSFAARDWLFPLKGYTRKALQKQAFQPGIYYGPYKKKGYSFFDGNKHGGHPAYDIFIKDKDQDCLDDRTKGTVEAVAMADTVVLSCNEGWTKESAIRGGNYVWMFSPVEGCFFYYAHLKEIAVRPGQFVVRGETIGTVGRSGRLAARGTSPTHLHLMVLRYEKGDLKPFDYYAKLPVPQQQKQ